MIGILGLSFSMFCTGWMCCWFASFRFKDGNVRKWLGGHVHPLWSHKSSDRGSVKE